MEKNYDESKELEEQFRKCIEDLRPVIGDLSKTYPLEIIENSLLEVALRSLMLRYGLEGTYGFCRVCNGHDESRPDHRKI